MKASEADSDAPAARAENRHGDRHPSAFPFFSAARAGVRRRERAASRPAAQLCSLVMNFFVPLIITYNHHVSMHLTFSLILRWSKLFCGRMPPCILVYYDFLHLNRFILRRRMDISQHVASEPELFFRAAVQGTTLAPRPAIVWLVVSRYFLVFPKHSAF